MKNFIVTLAVFLLLIIFPLQTALETVNEQRKSKFHNIVHVAAQKARQEGRFTDKIEEELEENLKRLVSSYGDPDEIKITLDKDIKYREDNFNQNNIITYSIEIPIGKIVAAAPILGIREEENKYIVSKEGFVLSEKLKESN